MRRKVLLAGIAIVLAFALWAWIKKAPKEHNECTDYELMQPVEVIVGHNQGASGLVLRVSQREETSDCLYLVRGQRGVEMPFSEWYEAWELADTLEYTEDGDEG